VRRNKKLVLIPVLLVCLLLVFRKNGSLKGYEIDGLERVYALGPVDFTVSGTEHDGEYLLPIDAKNEYFNLLLECDYEKVSSKKSDLPEGIRIFFDTGNGNSIMIYGYQLMAIKNGNQTDYYLILHKTAEQTERILRASNIIVAIIQR